MMENKCDRCKRRDAECYIEAYDPIDCKVHFFKTCKQCQSTVYNAVDRAIHSEDKPKFS